MNLSEQMTGKNIIITGANSGIGYETALELAKRGFEYLIELIFALEVYRKNFFLLYQSRRSHNISLSRSAKSRRSMQKNN